MKVHVLSAYPSGPLNPNNFQAQWVKESAALDPFREHTLTENPDDADIILFVENHPGHDPLFFQVARHPVWKRHRDRAFLYHDNDHVYPFLRGLYPSLDRSHQRPSRCVGAPYLGRIEQNEAVRYAPLNGQEPFLFSFMGSNNSPVRGRLLRLKFERALMVDTSDRNLWSLSTEDRRHYTETYGQALRNSSFILCPRGLGPSSYRLFETMEAGRVPVILADRWSPPPGPNWSEFSVSVPELDAGRLPEILAPLQNRAQSMGEKARKTWEDYFSKPVMFHRLTECCRHILLERKQTSALSEFLFTANLPRCAPKLLLRFIKRSIQSRNSLGQPEPGQTAQPEARDPAGAVK